MTAEWLLTRDSRDRHGQLQLQYWLVGPAGARCVRVTGQPAVFFVPAADRLRVEKCLAGSAEVTLRPLALLALDGAPVLGVYARTRAAWVAARRDLAAAGVALFEADIAPEERYLMERFITGQVQVLEGSAGPRLRPAAGRPGAADLAVLSLDIETNHRTNEVLSVALCQRGRGGCREQVILAAAAGTATDLAAPPGAELVLVADEAALLRATVAAVQDFDPDVLTGWNLVGFDLRLLADRCRRYGLVLAWGRDGSALRLSTAAGQWGDRLVARLAGRVVLDGLELLRSAGHRFPSFSLEAVSRDLLGRGKAIDHVANRAPEILRLHRQAPAELVAYNLEDTRLVLDILASTAVLELVLERVRLTGLPLVRWSGSVAAFDNLYLPRLHRAGRVAPAPGSGTAGASPGGHVLASRPGLHDNVLVLDFKSLYPSIIRSFLIDPLGLALGLAGADNPVPGYRGACFARSPALLPAIIEELWRSRDEARAEGDAPLSQALKLLMNSFYGVLGTPLGRFFDARLASSITLRGHAVLQDTRDWLEAEGYPVIYGDTDSLFVHLPGQPTAVAAATTGRELAAAINDWWAGRLADELALPSHLEMEFETHYRRFVMPTVRGAEEGSKKRYAGLAVAPDGSETLVFKGLESVRSDWSPLARQFQRDLYRLVFAGQPVRGLVRDTVAALQAGERDADLVLQRRLRKPLAEYTAAVPPHVRAARLQAAAERAAGLPVSVARGAWVRYVVTVNGPEPADHRQSAMDHGFYIERQLQPVADALLQFMDTSFSAELGQQGSLF